MAQIRGFKRVAVVAGGVVLGLPALVVGGLFYFGIPQNAAGMAAKGICSAAFVAGRPLANLMAEEVLPASPVLQAIRISIDEPNHTVTARFAGLVTRRAALLRDRGCVVGAESDPQARAYQPGIDPNRPWPAGDVAVPADQWGPGVDVGKLQQVAEAAFVGAGDPNGANARGLAVVQHGRLLLLRDAPGLAPGTPLHGWSMTKTITGMLTHKLAAEAGLPLDGPVVDAFPAGRAPAWVEDWRKDGRKDIKVSDLLYMRDGLKSTEDYNPWGSVPQMLWGANDTAAWAAAHPAEAAPGTRWRYLSATANLLAAVDRGRFDKDETYWKYPRTALFDPIGARSATLETDASGTWVGSSYMWASVSDWARLGQLVLQDGQWDGKQVLPPGWLKRASTPATAGGDGRGYGAMSWLYGNRQAGDCKAYPGVPEDMVAMGGHWGQVVAVVPSKDAVVVRMGWIHGPYDECKLLADVLSALPK
ncbi:serine hydrolase domain-containing protein [Rhodoferax saidenbachensis]|uniref:Beta-lactamase-related domain-containing protein n=1 Tax=Rhodoferax saidenbachensis TaxID=1484693 RepID=A0A1P8KE80_9BURK|nr:serine hydrolase [Rhodoferax saidenbachensis]APW44340.1 hypothetical protein RS694_18645 [Rhodoferax saidenbachensis]